MITVSDSLASRERAESRMGWKRFKPEVRRAATLAGREATDRILHFVGKRTLHACEAGAPCSVDTARLRTILPLTVAIDIAPQRGDLCSQVLDLALLLLGSRRKEPCRHESGERPEEANPGGH